MTNRWILVGSAVSYRRFGDPLARGRDQESLPSLLEDAIESTTPVDVTHVEELIQVLEKGLRAIQLYLPNNPMYHGAIENVQAGVRGVWEVESELTLKVTGDGFEYEGTAVQQSREKAESMSWVLYKDGVRWLTLQPGVEDDEIIRFLRLINAVRAMAPAAEQQEADDDLQTLLWEEDFAFIQYRAIELSTDDLPTLEPSPDMGAFAESEQVAHDLQGEADTPEETPPDFSNNLASVDDFESTLYFLEPGEIAYVKGEIDKEYEQDLHVHVVAMLLDIFELQHLDGPQGEVLDVFDNLVPFLMGAGNFHAVAYLLAETKPLLENGDLASDLRERLSQIPLRLSSPAAIGQLLQVLDEAPEPPTETELSYLFGQLNPASLPIILEWLPKLQVRSIAFALGRSLAPLARANPGALGQALSSPDVHVVLAAVDLVIQLESQRVTSDLLKLAQHPDVDVRAKLVEALKVVGLPTMLQQLSSMLSDEDRDVRVAAVKALTERQYRPAASAVEAIVTKGLRGADLSEKRAMFEAFGTLGGEDGIEFLSGVLVPKGLLRRKDDSETRACAAMALGKVGGKARDVLEQAIKDKDPLVRNAVDKALREVK